MKDRPARDPSVPAHRRWSGPDVLSHPPVTMVNMTTTQRCTVDDETFKFACPSCGRLHPHYLDNGGTPRCRHICDGENA